MLRLLLRVLPLFVLPAQLQAFVLLSGPDEARLDISYDSPTVSIYWNGRTPQIRALEEVPEIVTSSDTDEIAMRKIIHYALKTWSEVPGSFLFFELLEDSSIVPDKTDRIHSISVEQNDNKTSSAFAVPTQEDGVIVDCDITIGNSSVRAKYLAYTLIHELGHCLGLGHSHTNYGAIMGYARSADSLKLGGDDVAGLIYLYPTEGYNEKPQDILNCGSLPSTLMNTRGQSPLFLLSVLTLFFLPVLWPLLRLQA